MISVTINGKQYELDGPTLVVDYLEDRGLANRSLAVAINGDVLPRGDFADATIRDGDRVGNRPSRGRRLSPAVNPDSRALKSAVPAVQKQTFAKLPLPAGEGWAGGELRIGSRPLIPRFPGRSGVTQRSQKAARWRTTLERP